MEIERKRDKEFRENFQPAFECQREGIFTRDRAVVVLSKQCGRCEGVLLQLLEALEHASHQVAGHEDLGQLFVVPGLKVQVTLLF